MDLTKLLTMCYYLAFIWYCVVYICCAEYTFTTQPQSVLVSEGESVWLTCAWTPALSDDDFARWVHFPKLGGADIVFIEESNADYDVLIDKSSSGPKSLQLLIHSVKLHSGGYRCDIHNPNVQTSDQVSVGTIACTPRNYKGELGVTPVCSSSVSISLIWYREETTVATSSDDGRNLSAVALNDEDYGVTFTCKAFDGNDNTVIGTCQTTPLLFDVSIKKSPPGPLRLGNNFNLECLANGNANNYEYSWKFGLNKILSPSSNFTGKRYAIKKENPNIFTYRDVQNGLNNKNITCIVSRDNLEDVFVTYTVELSTSTATIPITKITIAENTNLFTRRPTIPTSRSTSDELSTDVNTDGQQEPVAMSQTIIIVIGVVVISLVILIMILIICFLSRRRKKKNGDVKNLESVPLEEPTYDDIKEKDNDNKITNTVFGAGKLLTDLTIYDEPTISNSNTKLDQPVNGQDDDQLASSRTDKYDTPQKAVSLDNLDTHNTISVEEANAMYAAPTKTRSRESIDAMYAKPNKTQSKESIDDLYSKPNKSAGNTPKLEHNTHKNVEGLTYADIEFQNENYPAPAPKDYGLDYASVQFSN